MTTSLNSPRRAGRGQRGAAALGVTMVLLFVMALGATFASRDLVFEQRTSANQYRSTQAFEAAEAGLQWAEAQLNVDRPLDADCKPAAAGTSFRTRYLGLDTRTRLLLPRTWTDAGRSAPLLPACVADGTAWSCRCPADGPAGVLRPPTAAAPSPAFSVQFLAGSKPGVVRVVATGCSNFGTPGVPQGPAADATARIEVSLGLLGALRVPPAAALTAAGRIDTALSAPTADNSDPATGIALQAGGDIAAVGARLIGPPGRPARAVAHDAALAARSPDQLFAFFFGLDKRRWQALPAVTRVSCRSDCAAMVAQALREAPGGGLLWVTGDLELAGPASLGTSARPVLIVVDGTARLRGAVAITGLLYASSVVWDDAAAGARVQGALVSEHDYRGTADARFVYATDVLGALSDAAGSFARIPGSWHDF